MRLRIGDIWISEESPHESFEIYNGILDTLVDSIKDFNAPFDSQPEGSKIFFWRRINRQEFDDFIVKVKGIYTESSYPYPWAGESKKSYLLRKIKKHNMKLQNN